MFKGPAHIICPECGAVLRPTRNRCVACGKWLGEGTDPIPEIADLIHKANEWMRTLNLQQQDQEKMVRKYVRRKSRKSPQKRKGRKSSSTTQPT